MSNLKSAKRNKSESAKRDESFTGEISMEIDTFRKVDSECERISKEQSRKAYPYHPPGRLHSPISVNSEDYLQHTANAMQHHKMSNRTTEPVALHWRRVRMLKDRTKDDDEVEDEDQMEMAEQTYKCRMEKFDAHRVVCLPPPSPASVCIAIPTRCHHTIPSKYIIICVVAEDLIYQIRKIYGVKL